MRMWMVDPRVMCRQHLLGEHKELHMLASSMCLGKTLDGHVTRGQLELGSMLPRHNELVAEMERRGWNHLTPLEQDFDEWGTTMAEALSFYDDLGKVDRAASRALLAGRCAGCRKLMGAR